LRFRVQRFRVVGTVFNRDQFFKSMSIAKSPETPPFLKGAGGIFEILRFVILLF
jgi:hypothetical protein